MEKSSKSKKKEQKYRGEILAKSKLFGDYQKDFLAAILGDEEYTIAEATEKISRYFDSIGRSER